MRQSTSRFFDRLQLVSSMGTLGLLLSLAPIGLAQPATETKTIGQETSPGSETTTPAQINAWIAALGDSRYAKRQAADEQLRRIATKDLSAIANRLDTVDGESFSRLLYLFSEIATDEQSPIAQDAFREISKRADRMNGSKGILAKNICHSIRIEIGRNAWSRYTRNAKNVSKDLSSRSSAQFSARDPLIVDSQFTGTVEDLRDLEQVDWVNFVRLRGPNITRGHLEAILKLPNLRHLQLVDVNLSREELSVIKNGPELDVLELQYVPVGDDFVYDLVEFPVWTEIWIYGTNITRAGVEQAEKRMGDVLLTFSRGAFLGVHCYNDSVRVDQVVPQSTAALAGIEPGDKLISVNGKPIRKFEDLRQELSFFAPDEEVEIEYEKVLSMERVKKKIPLGRRAR